MNHSLNVPHPSARCQQGKDAPNLRLVLVGVVAKVDSHGVLLEEEARKSIVRISKLRSELRTLPGNLVSAAPVPRVPNDDLGLTRVATSASEAASVFKPELGGSDAPVLRSRP